MMKNMMEYNGYHAMIEYDEDDELFVGTVIGISDSISFHGQNIQELKQHFKDNVDNYVDMCKQFGKQPEKEYNGILNIRISPEDHRKAVYVAASEGVSLNKLFSNYIHNGLKMI